MILFNLKIMRYRACSSVNSDLYPVCRQAIRTCFANVERVSNQLRFHHTFAAQKMRRKLLARGLASGLQNIIYLGGK
ncbi:hypothetical protein CSW98_09695 [Vibrio sp. HA2012]|nr:hypothetical protein CSW98_09695 [Vibrio sp. HA2012]